MIKAEVVQHSASPVGGPDLFTLVLQYPRCIHGEFLTHREFSRCSMSSRAVPVRKMIEQVKSRPFVPLEWGSNQAGMQSGAEVSPAKKIEAEREWRRAAEHAAYFANSLTDLGLHKQIVNRLLEPFQWMKTIVTATGWDNFDDLRDHPAAEPHFQRLAKAIKQARRESVPVVRPVGHDNVYSWHLPFISAEERAAFADQRVVGAFTLARVSAARCARVSYLNHDGTNPDIQKDLDLFHKLAGSKPMHASPLEHAAFCNEVDVRFANFQGWTSLRWVMENVPVIDRIGEDIAEPN